MTKTKLQSMSNGKLLETFENTCYRSVHKDSEKISKEINWCKEVLLKRLEGK